MTGLWVALLVVGLVMIAVAVWPRRRAEPTAPDGTVDGSPAPTAGGSRDDQPT